MAGLEADWVDAVIGGGEGERERERRRGQRWTHTGAMKHGGGGMAEMNGSIDPVSWVDGLGTGWINDGGPVAEGTGPFWIGLPADLSGRGDHGGGKVQAGRRCGLVILTASVLAEESTPAAASRLGGAGVLDGVCLIVFA
ncbi:hypothetical protein M0R45_002044 [Rubus argutus]|uniref:Uncharacterized protein n=1 Tax=Rubus argutus TaxID=59490 RepID=A0AAW1VIU6_RUBAR